MEARTPDQLADDLEAPWRAFLVAVLGNAVANCRWLSRAARQPHRCWTASRSSAFVRRLVCAAVGWEWVFSGRKSTLDFGELCAELGVDEDYVRRRILADCLNHEDINQVVRRTIRDILPLVGSRKCPSDSAQGEVDWAALSERRGEAQVFMELAPNTRTAP